MFLPVTLPILLSPGRVLRVPLSERHPTARNDMLEIGRRADEHLLPLGGLLWRLTLLHTGKGRLELADDDVPCCLGRLAGWGARDDGGGDIWSAFLEEGGRIRVTGVGVEVPDALFAAWLLVLRWKGGDVVGRGV